MHSAAKPLVTKEPIVLLELLQYLHKRQAKVLKLSKKNAL